MATEMSGVPCCWNGDGHEHGCLDALAISLSSVSMYKHLDFQLVIKRLKEAGLYSAGRGNILPESVIGQLLPADADEASRKALNVIFDVGRQALPGSRRLCLRQLCGTNRVYPRCKLVWPAPRCFILLVCRTR